MVSCLAMAMVALFALPTAYAESLVVESGQETYTYGDYLEIIIQVDHVSEPFANLWIYDSEGKPSSAIPVSLSGPTTTFSAQFPFDRTVFSPGQYRIMVEYSGFEAGVLFDLVDTDAVVVPNWIRQVAFYWINEDVSGDVYLDALESLQESGTLSIPGSGSVDYVPQWVMLPTWWWIQGLVDDEQYVILIQYLADSGMLSADLNS